MVKNNDIMKRLDNHIKHIQPILLEKCDVLERENKTYREEILRLQEIIKGLVTIIGDKIFIKSLNK